MTKHNCPRCGVELHWTRRSWVDKHPAAAVTAGLFTLVWVSMMLSVYPVAAAVMIVLAAVGGAVYWASAERRRRDALAARADYENRKWMEASVKWPDPGSAPLLSQVERAAAAGFPRRPAAKFRRPVDHWSPTEPMSRGA